MPVRKSKLLETTEITRTLFLGIERGEIYQNLHLENMGTYGSQCTLKNHTFGMTGMEK